MTFGSVASFAIFDASIRRDDEVGGALGLAEDPDLRVDALRVGDEHLVLGLDLAHLGALGRCALGGRRDRRSDAQADDDTLWAAGGGEARVDLVLELGAR